ncbi:MAG: YjbQ family protein [Pararhodobacter sp.]|nr:YjbQ family protein [Pararhodobacter sp.]
MHKTFSIATQGPGLYEITPQIAGWLRRDMVAEGVLTLFIQHTSASLVIQENADPDVPRDMSEYFHRLVPPADDPSMCYLRHTSEGVDDMPAHIKAALLPVSLQIPVLDGEMALGNWQGIFVFEHRRRPHRRDIIAMLR